MYFRGMYQRVHDIVLACDICGLTKPRNKPIVAEPALYELACQPFERMHVDHMTNDWVSSKRRYVCSAVDAMSGYIVAWACHTLTAEEFARTFYVNVVLKYGAPKRLVSDNATNFKSELWSEVAKLLGIELVFVKKMTSRTNGMAERSIGCLRQTLSAMQLQNKLEWDYNLPSAVFALNNTPSRNTGLSAHQIIFGKSARLPIDNILASNTEPEEFNDVMKSIWRAQNEAQERAIDAKAKQDYRSFQNRPQAKNITDIRPGSVVYWLKPNAIAGKGTLGQRFYGPFKVLDSDRFGAKLQHLDTGVIEKSRVNIEHLKPVQVNPDYFKKPHYSHDEVYRSQKNRFSEKFHKNSEE